MISTPEAQAHCPPLICNTIGKSKPEKKTASCGSIYFAHKVLLQHQRVRPPRWCGGVSRASDPNHYGFGSLGGAKSAAGTWWHDFTSISLSALIDWSHQSRRFMVVWLRKPPTTGWWDYRNFKISVWWNCHIRHHNLVLVFLLMLFIVEMVIKVGACTSGDGDAQF